MKSNGDCDPALSDYSPLAAEYYDSGAHPTCDSFSRLSISYIEEQLASIDLNSLVLEVGAGRSCVAPYFSRRAMSMSQLEISDLSASMLSHSKKWVAFGAKLSVMDAAKLPHRDGSVSVVVASLGDPYNTHDFWRNVARVLKPNGRIIFTCPSFEWAARFRASSESKIAHSAEFISRDGTIFRVRSYVPPLSCQVGLIEESGLTLTDFSALGVDGNPSNVVPPKISATKDGKRSVVWGFVAERFSRPIPSTFRKAWHESLNEVT